MSSDAGFSVGLDEEEGGGFARAAAPTPPPPQPRLPWTIVPKSGGPRATLLRTTTGCDGCAALRADNSRLIEELESLRAVIAVLRSSGPVAAAAEGGAGGAPSSLAAAAAEVPASAAAAVAHAHRRSTSLLPDGRQLLISPDELAGMRSLFNVFDKDGDGKIGEEDLRALHARLGEPISEDEARGAVEMIGQGLGAVTFADFAAFWDGSHVSLQKQMLIEEGAASPNVLQAERAKRRAHYTAKFTFLRAKVPSPALARVSTEACGPCPSLEYRLRFFYDAGPALGGKVEISPWHDVPLFNADGTLNMIVEVPKWSRRKFEIATGEPLNPIKQDVKNGQLREYGWGDMFCNYGAFPQTWEDPKHVDPNTKCGGDNDPLDVIDVGNRRWDTGSIVRVKVLGVLGLIDAGETDWKVIAVSAEDPLAPLLNNVDDLHVHIPGVMEALTKWLRLYKLPVMNEFAFNGEPRTREFAEALIRDTHESWKMLVEERSGGGGAAGAAGNSLLAAGLRRSGSAGTLASLVSS